MYKANVNDLTKEQLGAVINTQTRVIQELEQQLSKAQADLEVSVNLLNELLAETVHREECESMHSEDDDEELTCNCGEYARSVKVRLFIEQIKEKKDE